MVKRNIVKIDEQKCNGCGQCINACAEGAIQLVNGKAKLVSEIYCDGLGACIGSCPQDAITVEQREAEQFDEEAAKKHLTQQKQKAEELNFACPGLMTRTLRGADKSDDSVTNIPSRLANWPVQLRLVSPQATYFNNADVLLVADCVPFAAGNFHNSFLKGRILVVGCPKLDDSVFYVEKLAQILKANTINSLTVMHMEVPCCFGLVNIAEKAVASAGVNLPFRIVNIAFNGTVRSDTTAQPAARGNNSTR